MKRLSAVAKRLYLPLVFAAVGLLVWWRWDGLTEIFRQVSPVWLTVALVASVITLVPQAWFWHKALADFGEDASTLQVFSATCRAIMTRYAPGGVWFAAGRAAILNRQGVGLPALAATGTVELVMSVSVALAFGTAILGISPDVPEWSRWLGPAVLLGLFLSVPLFNKGITWLAHRRQTDLPNPLTRRMVVDLIFINALYWAVISTVFWLYAIGFGINAPAPITHGAFMIGWGVGFLSPSPQGLGVLEVIVAAILGGNVIDMATIVLGFRGLMLVRDATVWVVAEVVNRRSGGTGNEG